MSVGHAVCTHQAITERESPRRFHLLIEERGFASVVLDPEPV
jgi:hypothetical protein